MAEDIAGPDGVVLVWQTGKPPAGAAWRWGEASPDVFYEREVLVYGVIEGAEVEQP